MTEMIERVAQAICGDNNPDNILSVHRDRARAALQAISEPTEAMLNAAQEWAGQQSYTDFDVIGRVKRTVLDL